MSLSNGVTYFSAVLFVIVTHTTFLGVLKMMIMECTHGKYCDMLLTLSTSDSRAGTAAMECALCYPGQRHPDASVFRQLEYCLCETGSVTPMAHVNAGRLQTVRTPANEGAIIAAVEQELWSREIT
jgi:hypothetical protein